MDFVSTRVDPDEYRGLAVRSEGQKYYELLLIYVDDILLISHDLAPGLTSLGQIYNLKENSLGKPL